MFSGPEQPPFVRLQSPLLPRSTGTEIIHNPLWNKGTAFSQYERDQLGLRGLVPPGIKTLDQQVKRVLRHMDREEDNGSKAQNTPPFPIRSGPVSACD